MYLKKWFNLHFQGKIWGGEALWFPVIALATLGVVFVYSSSGVFSQHRYGDEFLFLKKHLMYSIMGMGAAGLGMFTPLSFYKKWKKVIVYTSISLVFFTYLPGIGRKVLGASRWIDFKIFRFQPSEILKLSMVIFAAQSPKNRFFWVTLVLSLGLLYGQPDFGSCLLVLWSVGWIMYLEGVPGKYFMYGSIGFIPAFLVLLIIAPYRLRRLGVYLNPFKDPLGSGFQIIQSLLGIANGGWFGKGLGSSQQKLFFLPEAHTDFVLSVMTEEIGFLGFFVICLLYLIFMNYLIFITIRTKDAFAKSFALGIAALFMGSIVINMGVVCGLLPAKGLPLPFLSSGGTSLLMSYFMVGVCARIHRFHLG